MTVYEVLSEKIIPHIILCDVVEFRMWRNLPPHRCFSLDCGEFPHKSFGKICKQFGDYQCVDWSILLKTKNDEYTGLCISITYQ